jgi:hypothetical protein
MVFWIIIVRKQAWYLNPFWLSNWPITFLEYRSKSAMQRAIHLWGMIMRISGFDYSGYFVRSYDPADAVKYCLILFCLPSVEFKLWVNILCIFNFCIEVVCLRTKRIKEIFIICRICSFHFKGVAVLCRDTIRQWLHTSPLSGFHQFLWGCHK